MHPSGTAREPPPTRTPSRLAAAALALTTCGPTRAAIMVRVYTDITQGASGDLRSVRVRVFRGVGPTRAPRHDSVRAVGAGGTSLPFRFAVLPLSNDESGVVTVEVTGCADATCGDARPGYAPGIVEQRAIVAFLPGQVWELPVFLASNCRGLACDDPRLELTCRPETRTCVSGRVSPQTPVASPDGSDLADATLVPVDHAPPPVDAWSPDDASIELPPTRDAADTAGPDAKGDVTTGPRSCGGDGAAQTCRPNEDCCFLGACGCTVLAVCTPRGLVGCR